MSFPLYRSGKKTLSGTEYHVRDTQRTSDSFFHSLAWALDYHGLHSYSKTTYKSLRSEIRRVVEVLRDPLLWETANWSGFGQAYADTVDSDYLYRVSLDGTYPDNLVLRAAAEAYGVTLKILPDGSGSDLVLEPKSLVPRTTLPEKNEEIIICLMWANPGVGEEGDRHFKALEPVEEEEEREPVVWEDEPPASSEIDSTASSRENSPANDENFDETQTAGSETTDCPLKQDDEPEEETDPCDVDEIKITETLPDGSTREFIVVHAGDSRIEEYNQKIAEQDDQWKEQWEQKQEQEQTEFEQQLETRLQEWNSEKQSAQSTVQEMMNNFDQGILGTTADSPASEEAATEESAEESTDQLERGPIIIPNGGKIQLTAPSRPFMEFKYGKDTQVSKVKLEVTSQTPCDDTVHPHLKVRRYSYYDSPVESFKVEHPGKKDLEFPIFPLTEKRTCMPATLEIVIDAIDSFLESTASYEITAESCGDEKYSQLSCTLEVYSSDQFEFEFEAQPFAEFSREVEDQIWARELNPLHTEEDSRKPGDEVSSRTVTDKGSLLWGTMNYESSHSIEKDFTDSTKINSEKTVELKCLSPGVHEKTETESSDNGSSTSTSKEFDPGVFGFYEIVKTEEGEAGEEPEESSEKQNIELPVSISLKRNGENDENTAALLDTVMTIINAIRNTAEMWNEFQNLVPQIGFKYSCTLSLLGGKISKSWGWKEQDHRCFMGTTYSGELTLIETKIELSFGFSAEFCSVQAEAMIFVNIAGNIAVSFSFEVANPIEEERSAKERRSLQFPTEIPAEAGAKMVAGKPDWFEVQGVVESGFGSEIEFKDSSGYGAGGNFGKYIDYNLWFKGMTLKGTVHVTGVCSYEKEYDLFDGRYGRQNPWMVGKFPGTTYAPKHQQEKIRVLNEQITLHKKDLSELKDKVEKHQKETLQQIVNVEDERQRMKDDLLILEDRDQAESDYEEAREESDRIEEERDQAKQDWEELENEVMEVMQEYREKLDATEQAKEDWNSAKDELEYAEKPASSLNIFNVGVYSEEQLQELRDKVEQAKQTYDQKKQEEEDYKSQTYDPTMTEKDPAKNEARKKYLDLEYDFEFAEKKEEDSEERLKDLNRQAEEVQKRNHPHGASTYKETWDEEKQVIQTNLDAVDDLKNAWKKQLKWYADLYEPEIQKMEQVERSLEEEERYYRNRFNELKENWARETRIGLMEDKIKEDQALLGELFDELDEIDEQIKKQEEKINRIYEESRSYFKDHDRKNGRLETIEGSGTLKEAIICGPLDYYAKKIDQERDDLMKLFKKKRKKDDEIAYANKKYEVSLRTLISMTRSDCVGANIVMEGAKKAKEESESGATDNSSTSGSTDSNSG